MLGMAAGCGDGSAARHPIPTDTKIWLVADDIAGSDADPVASWPDHNGGNTFVQATAGNKPLLKKGANGFNGHNVVLFDGVDDFVGYGSTITMTGKSMSVVYVALNNDGTLENVMLFMPNSDWGPSGFGSFFMGNGNGGLNDHSLGITYSGLGFGATAQNPPGAVNVKAVEMYLKDGTGWTITSSGGGAALTPADTSDVFVIQPKIGFNPALSPPYSAFPGKIAELIVWNRKLTGTESSNVMANLRAKYGI